jgi:hypothetical protein
MPIKSVLPGYPIYQGSKKISVIDFKGLSTYTPGGETINASQFGEGGIDFIEPMNKKQISVAGDLLIVASSFSGTYYVTIEVAAAAVGAVQSVTIKWYVTATGAECGALDLSAEEIRFLAIFV